MFSASPLFELASIVARDIRADLTPQQCYKHSAKHQKNHFFLGENPLGGYPGDDFEKPTHVYVGVVSSVLYTDFLRVCVLPGHENADGSIAPVGVLVFTGLTSSGPFQFTGYRIPLH